MTIGGNRTLTVQPVGTKVYTPFPEYEKTVPVTGSSTERNHYYLAGQLVAVRVKVAGQTGAFYYFYTDRQGSVHALRKADGTWVNGSTARYDAFGGYRTKPATTVNPDISDRGYTGHRMNNTGNDLGLIYMNARYYLPEVGRFISADTIVPDPSNPQSFNRYSYTLNSPVNFTDPTGHLTEDEVLEYIGFSSREEMIQAGWGRFLVDWLWNPDVTWGDVFTYNDGEGEAMLVLFEALARASGRYQGGFYRLNGDQYGTALSYSSIRSLNDDTSRATALEKKYQNEWASLPVRSGTDGTPYYVPAKYVNVATKGVVGAGASLVGGAAVMACVVVEPCGVIAGGTTAATLATSVGAAATLTGFFIATWDVLSPDVSLTQSYPVMLIPDQTFPGPQQEWPYHLVSPQGAYK